MKSIAADVPQEVVDLANIIAWERIPENQQRARIKELTLFIEGRGMNRKISGKNYGGEGGQRVRGAVPQWVLDILSEYDYSPYTNKSAFTRKAMRSGAIAYLKAHKIPLFED